jgi:membrane protein DedA with SNARE-associated domain
MLESVLTSVTGFITGTIGSLGYTGVVVLMGIESAAVPLPSEIILPFAGSLVPVRFSLIGVALAGAIGCVVGSVLTYELGYFGGRPLIERYGRYILLSPRELAMAERWVQRFGAASTFFSRLLPVVRTYISIPAGILRVPRGKFILYTFLGSFLWSLLLGYLGMRLGPHWQDLRARFHGLDTAIAVAILGGIVIFVWHRIRERRRYGRGSP